MHAMLARSIFPALVAAFAFAGPACGQQVLQRIAARDKVVIGYGESSAPFSFLQGGKPVGYSIALCEDVAQRVRQALGRPDLGLQFLPVDQDAVPRLVGSSTIDIMCAGVSDTPQRRRTMAFSAPIFVSSVKLMVRKADGPQDVAGLKGKTVAVLGRTTAEAAVQDLDKRRKLGLNISTVVSAEAAISQLRLKQVDAWARDEVLLLGAVAGQPDASAFRLLDGELSSEVIALAMGRDEKLRKLVDEVLADDVRSGRMQRLYEQWFGREGAPGAGGFSLPMSSALKAAFDRLR